MVNLKRAFNNIKIGKANGPYKIKSDYLKEIGPANSGLYNVIKDLFSKESFLPNGKS